MRGLKFIFVGNSKEDRGIQSSLDRVWLCLIDSSGISSIVFLFRSIFSSVRKTFIMQSGCVATTYLNETIISYLLFKIKTLSLVCIITIKQDRV